MSDYLLLGAVTFIVLGTSFLLRPKYQRPPAYIGDREDVTTLVRTAAIKKTAMWEVFDGLAKKYGAPTRRHDRLGMNADWYP